jgi:hypothetical protein
MYASAPTGVSQARTLGSLVGFALGQSIVISREPQ